MPKPQFFNSFVLELGKETHNLTSDTLKWMLSNTAPVATNTQKSNITEISAGSGYTAGGATWTNVTWTQSSGVARLEGDDVTWTFSGTPATFRYAVLYNDTAANDELICWIDYGVGLSYINTQIHTIDINDILGLFSIQMG
jgi:hypothetical protein